MILKLDVNNLFPVKYDGDTYSVKCKCGWMTEDWYTSEHAMATATHHVEYYCSYETFSL